MKKLIMISLACLFVFSMSTASYAMSALLPIGDGHSAAIWEAEYRSPTSHDMKSKRILVNPDGSSITTGIAYKRNDYNITDIVLIKYDTNGNRIWVNNLDINEMDKIKDAAVAPDGNIVITGLSGTDRDHDLLLAKYSQNGGQMWLQSFSHPCCRKTEGRAMAIGAGGNIYVSGKRDNHFFIGAWDADGYLLWTDDDSQSRDGRSAIVAVPTSDGDLVFVTKPDSMGFRRKVIMYNGADGSGKREFKNKAQFTTLTYGAGSDVVVAGGHSRGGRPYFSMFDLDLNQLADHEVGWYKGEIKALAVSPDSRVFASADVDGYEAKDVYTYSWDPATESIYWDELFSGLSTDLDESDDTVAVMEILNAGDMVGVAINSDYDPKGLIANMVLSEKYEINFLMYHVPTYSILIFDYISGKFMSDLGMDVYGNMYFNGRTPERPADELRGMWIGKLSPF